jgi:hypothetical protein
MSKKCFIEAVKGKQVSIYYLLCMAKFVISYYMDFNVILFVSHAHHPMQKFGSRKFVLE